MNFCIAKKDVSIDYSEFIEKAKVSEFIKKYKFEAYDLYALAYTDQNGEIAFQSLMPSTSVDQVWHTGIDVATYWHIKSVETKGVRILDISEKAEIIDGYLAGYYKEEENDSDFFNVERQKKIFEALAEIDRLEHVQRKRP